MRDWILTIFPSGYDAILRFDKTVEGRAPDPTNPAKDYARIVVGDRAVMRAIDEENFRPTGRDDLIFPVTFNNLYTGKTPQEAIRKMLRAEGVYKLLPGFHSLNERIGAYMGLPGYPERIAKWGIHAIGLGPRIRGSVRSLID